MRKLNLISLGIYSAIASSVAMANSLPKNHTVQSGQANVVNNNGDMIIQQTTPRVKIDWESFDIGQSNSVTFQQPSDVAVAYNRVTGGNASQIHGKLDANGRVFLANPNGVIFGKEASVNVGALLATTKELAANQNDFDNATELTFVKPQDKTEGEILNQGKLTATGKQNGFIVLVGNQVKNEGTITANSYSKSTTETKRICNLGPEYTVWCDQNLNNGAWIEDTFTSTISTPAQVFLGVGDGFTLDLDDRSNSISVSLTNSDVERLIENKGMIVANNGDITLTAGGRSQVIDMLINQEGILEASSVSERNGTITLGASKINLGAESQLKADGTLRFKSARPLSAEKDKNITIKAEKGAVISAKETVISADKLQFEGEFNRGSEKRFFSDEFGSKNHFKFDGKGVLQVSDEKPEGFDGNFISSSALSSILASHGTTTLNLAPVSIRKEDGTRTRVQGELKLDNANVNVESFQNSDALLKLNAAQWKMDNTNITSTGRLTLVQDIPYRTPLDQAGSWFNNVTLDLANGSLGVGRSERRGYYLNAPANSVEDEARSELFDVNWQHLTLNRVDDIAIAGGFRHVDIDHLNHTGRANFYIHGGNKRIWRPAIPATESNPEKKAQYGWEYAIQNIEERVTRSRRNHDCPRCKRWNYSANLADNYLAREFFDTYDMWNVTQNREHLDTRINISNSNIKTHHGFVHLMAKEINLKDSNVDISFERDLTFDSLQRRIHKLGLNGKTVLDNTHIKIVGPEANNTAPDSRDGAAGMFVLGEMVGKNSSTVFAKMQQGYTLRTDGNTTLKGETGQDDLKLTLVNTGTTQDLNISITADQPNEGNTAFSPGDARGTKTVLENVTLNLIAPNGAPAYYSSDAIPIEIKDSKVAVFEQPRTQRTESAKFNGEASTLSLEDATKIVNDQLGIVPEVPAPPVAESPSVEEPRIQPEVETAPPAAPPVQPDTNNRPAPSTPPASAASQAAVETANAAVTQQAVSSAATNALLESIAAEKEVEVEICQEGEECETLSVGEKDAEGKVSVGDIQ